MPFQRFMELALYHPEHGYYSNQITDVGSARADFSTWATLSDMGSWLAPWITSEIESLQWQKLPAIHLIEIGAGDGSLAKSILKHLGWQKRRRSTYHIVEVSKPLRTIQKQSLSKYANRVRWHQQIDSALSAAQGQAIVFSNELVDAFPAQWLRWDGALWHEIQVEFSADTGLHESFHPTDLDFSAQWPAPPIGQRIEYHPAYRDWLTSWAAALEHGTLLTIDYGDLDLQNIYQRRPAGTMRGYFRQQRIEAGGVYQRFGQQDLTCDVNFGDLKIWGENLGFETITSSDQRKFSKPYLPHGFQSQNQSAEGAFRVLHQRRIKNS